jgi:23S rRNA (guanosine2251-2'-O)-methyltransferase
MQEIGAMIYGTHAVREALMSRPDTVRTIYVAGNDGARAVAVFAKEKGVKVETLNLKKLSKNISPDAVHQGVVAEVDLTKLVRAYEEFVGRLNVTEDTALVILGEVQDPHNVGAVIRSAAAFGIAGVLIPEHRQAQVNGTVIKVSAGMAFRVPLVSIGNVNSAVRDLKERGFWVYGLDGRAEQSITNEVFQKPSVFILGNEGTGIREKTLELSDIPLSIPIHTGVESLNVSATAAVVLYAWSIQHPHIPHTVQM